VIADLARNSNWVDFECKVKTATTAAKS